MKKKKKKAHEGSRHSPVPCWLQNIVEMRRKSKKEALLLTHSFSFTPSLPQWSLTLFPTSPSFSSCLFPCFLFRTQFSVSARDLRLSSTSATPTPTRADSLPGSVSLSICPMAVPSSADQPAGSPMDASWSTSCVSGPPPPFSSISMLISYQPSITLVYPSFIESVCEMNKEGAQRLHWLGPTLSERSPLCRLMSNSRDRE